MHGKPAINAKSLLLIGVVTACAAAAPARAAETYAAPSVEAASVVSEPLTRSLTLAPSPQIVATASPAIALPAGTVAATTPIAPQATAAETPAPQKLADAASLNNPKPRPAPAAARRTPVGATAAAPVAAKRPPVRVAQRPGRQAVVAAPGIVSPGPRIAYVQPAMRTPALVVGIYY